MSGGSSVIGNQSVLSRMVALTKSMAQVDTSETTTSGSYVNLTTAGPSVTLTPGVTQDHLLWYKARITNSTAATMYTPSIAGAAGSDADAAWGQGTGLISPANAHNATAQATGSTHAMKYAVTGGTGTYVYRRVVGTAC